jgi:hypothetical protein
MGFLVEHTLVPPAWTASTGMRASWDHHPTGDPGGDQITETSKDYQAAVDQLSAGDSVTVQTILPDGTRQEYPDLQTMTFSTRDMVRLFWLPYIVGLAFLVMGIWIYRLRGHTAPGQAFAFFCACAAIVTCLLFDQVTTHAGAVLWTLVIAQLGAAVISLAMVFPEAWKPIRKRAWLRYLPYLLSVAIALWGISVLYNQANPWAYVST